MLKNNPYIRLIRLYRRFVPNRKLAVLMRSFHLIARIIYLAIPYFVAQILNAIQQGGPDMRNAILMNIIYLSLVPLVEWIFHGNARVWEQNLRFQTEKAYKLYLFQAVTSFDVSWHNDNHSGEIIDKIEKAASGLRDFATNMFMYLGVFVTLAGAVVALILIWPLAGVLLPIVGTIIFLIIRRFDIRIVELIKAKNKKDHRVSSLIFDYLSNIKTIITLRFVEKTWGVLQNRIDDTYPFFRKRVIIDERKRFIVSMALTAAIGLMLGWYTYSQIAAT